MTLLGWDVCIDERNLAIQYEVQCHQIADSRS